MRLTKLARAALHQLGDVVELLDAVARFELRFRIRCTEQRTTIVRRHDPVALA
jgi:hypothetical protein